MEPRFHGGTALYFYLVHVKIATLALVWRRILKMGLTAQVSASSSESDSKLWGPFQNRVRVALNWDVNIIKLY